MKKLLSIIGAISLVGTSTTSVISCANSDDTTECERNNVGNFKQMCTIDKPFNKVDNKWYIVISKLNLKDNWEIFKFQNKEIKPGYILNTSNPKINMSYWLASNYFTIGINKNDDWSTFQGWITGNKHFKAVYQYIGNDEPNVPNIDNDGNIIV